MAEHQTMRKYSSNMDFNKIIRSAIRSGLWTFEQGTKHGALRHVNGHKQTIPHSPSDFRALLNFKRDLLRMECSPVHQYTSEGE